MSDSLLPGVICSESIDNEEIVRESNTGLLFSEILGALNTKTRDNLDVHSDLAMLPNIKQTKLRNTKTRTANILSETTRSNIIKEEMQKFRTGSHHRSKNPLPPKLKPLTRTTPASKQSLIKAEKTPPISTHSTQLSDYFPNLTQNIDRTDILYNSENLSVYSAASVVSPTSSPDISDIECEMMEMEPGLQAISGHDRKLRRRINATDIKKGLNKSTSDRRNTRDVYKKRKHAANYLSERESERQNLLQPGCENSNNTQHDSNDHLRVPSAAFNSSNSNYNTASSSFTTPSPNQSVANRTMTSLPLSVQFMSDHISTHLHADSSSIEKLAVELESSDQCTCVNYSIDVQNSCSYCYRTFLHQGWCDSQRIVELPKCKLCSGVVLSLIQSPPQRKKKVFTTVQQTGLLSVPSLPGSDRPLSTDSMKKYTFNYQNFQKYKQEQDKLIEPQRIIVHESDDTPLITTPITQIKCDELRNDMMRDNSNLTNLQLLTPRLSQTTDVPLDESSLYSVVQRSRCSERSIKSKLYHYKPSVSLNISRSFVYSYFDPMHKYRPLPGYEKLLR